MTKILLSALAARRGGGLTYVRNIARTFPQGPHDRLSILSPDPIEGLPDRPNIEWIRAPRWTRLPIPRFLLGFFFFRFFWLRRRDFDVVYYAGGTFDAPLPGSAARIVSFCNMLPFDWTARGRYGPGWMRFRHWLLRFVQGRAMARADFVIFISEHGRDVIDRALGRRRGGSTVIPHGVHGAAAPLDPETARRLPERFILYLSTIDAYKAQVELIEAWALLRRRRPLTEKLVLAGPEYAPYARRVRATIRRHGLEEQVILLGQVPYQQVFDLAGRALFNLFLSSCENCPNSMIELMRTGRALLASSWQPMPELGGPELDYVDPYDVPALAEALERLIDDEGLRRRLGEAAERRSWLYSWDKAGAATWKAIQAVADRRAAPAPAPSGAPLAARR